MSYSKPGKNTSANKLANKRPSDPIDLLIHERGLRIRDVYIDRSLDLMLLVLNNGQVVRSSISGHKLLRDATQKQLEGWQLIAGGTGVNWPKLDEDLSLRGFIHSSLMDQAVKNLAMPTRTPGKTKQVAK
ncbi:MAG: DUF2442 domain-containing protein [Flavobacteriales bacterium]|nr:DUF2442 domain-containing protein [Flavobacteriales bacterium]MBP6696800.1 DUF2442 domain-containing protein [Flavobacteriales bacterium]